MTWEAMDAASPGYTKKTTMGCLRAYIQGKKNVTLVWVIACVERHEVRGQDLEDIFDQFRGMEDEERFQRIYEHCQEEGWLD